jgi:hypothetical protein
MEVMVKISLFTKLHYLVIHKVLNCHIIKSTAVLFTFLINFRNQIFLESY